MQNGLEIHAGNRRDLWVDLDAPRVLREVSGNFAIQTTCVPVSAEKPDIGGLLIWRDKGNFLRLDKGTGGQNEILFLGCLDGRTIIIGRGCLPATRIFLRLEKLDDRVNALCSSDGREWFSVGHVEFPTADPVEVGLDAIGNIHRTIYHGAFPAGTAIRFESFQLFSV